MKTEPPDARRAAETCAHRFDQRAHDVQAEAGTVLAVHLRLAAAGERGEEIGALGDPTPSSLTVRCTRSPTFATASSIRPPFGEYLRAFSVRCQTAWRSAARSAVTSASSVSRHPIS